MLNFSTAAEFGERLRRILGGQLVLLWPKRLVEDRNSRIKNQKSVARSSTGNCSKGSVSIGKWTQRKESQWGKIDAGDEKQHAEYDFKERSIGGCCWLIGCLLNERVVGEHNTAPWSHENIGNWTCEKCQRNVEKQLW